MKALLKLSILLALVWAANPAGAVVVDFDDLGPVIGSPDPNNFESGFGTLPVEHAALTWDQFDVMHKDYYGINYDLAGTGFEIGAVSGNYAALNRWAAVANVGGKPFVLQSASLTAAEFETLPVTVTGHRNGVEVYSSTVDTHLTSPTMFAFPAVTVDSVSFAPGVEGGVFVLDDFTYATIPAVDAGQDIQVSSESHETVIIHGTAADEGQAPLVYRWLEREDVISDWQDVGVNGEAGLDLGPASSLPEGAHILRLEVKHSDAEIMEADDMILTVITESPADDQPPSLAPKSSKIILWPPFHQMMPVTIVTNAVDNSDGPVTLKATVKSNEPLSVKGRRNPRDWTEPVIDQATGVITLKLRSERNPENKKRVYTITITATDPSGNSSRAVVRITVARVLPGPLHLLAGSPK